MIESGYKYRVPRQRANAPGRGTRNWRFPMQRDDSTRRIPLTQGKFVLVDAADFEMVGRGHWYLMGNGYVVGYIGGHPQGMRLALLHRVIMLPASGEQVDHINRDKLDCRRANLRVCTPRENSHNQPKRSNNRSGFKGVSWHRRYRRWQVTIRVEGVKAGLGSFTDKDAAARAYDAKAKELYGEFAVLNFPEGARDDLALQP